MSLIPDEVEIICELECWHKEVLYKLWDEVIHDFILTLENFFIKSSRAYQDRPLPPPSMIHC
jgi:hypothetical protein